MNYLISIVGVFLSGKENYQEWSQKVKVTLIFNDFWDSFCENKDGSEQEKPEDEKQLVRQGNKDKKAYALISTFDNIRGKSQYTF